MTWPLPLPIVEPVRALLSSDLTGAIHGLGLKQKARHSWVQVAVPALARPRDVDVAVARDECLAIVAHELRNALGPVRMAAAILSTPGASASASDTALGIINRQLANMTRLVDDLVDGARIAQGKMDMRLAPVDLAEVLRHAMEAVGEQIAQRDQHVWLSLPAGPWCVLGDTTRLDQVFGNLLSNASKFTRQGGQIWLSAAKVNAANGTSDVVVRIRDDGIGIAPALSPHVFDLFKQAGRSPHQASGLGVGLALVRRLVELHGGRVSVQSAGLDRGSEFVVTLPLHEAHAQAELPPTSPQC